jgi:hypothetical protein
MESDTRIEGPVKTGEEGSVTIGRHLLEALLDHRERSRVCVIGG